MTDQERRDYLFALAKAGLDATTSAQQAASQLRDWRDAVKRLPPDEPEPVQ